MTRLRFQFALLVLAPLVLLTGFALESSQTAGVVTAGTTEISQRFPPPFEAGVTPISTPVPTNPNEFDAVSSFAYSLAGTPGTFTYEYHVVTTRPSISLEHRPWSFVAGSGQISGEANGTYDGHLNFGSITYTISNGTGSYAGASGSLVAVGKVEYVEKGQPYMIISGSIDTGDSPKLTPRAYLPIVSKDTLSASDR